MDLSFGPIPERSKMAEVPYVSLDRITSLRASIQLVSPDAVCNTTPVAPNWFTGPGFKDILIPESLGLHRNIRAGIALGDVVCGSNPDALKNCPDTMSTPMSALSQRRRIRNQGQPFKLVGLKSEVEYWRGIMQRSIQRPAMTVNHLTGLETTLL